MAHKFKIGEIVKVYEYYADMIVKDCYFGVIVDVDEYTWSRELTTGLGQETNSATYIYRLLPNEEKVGRVGIQTAEEFAIEEIQL